MSKKSHWFLFSYVCTSDISTVYGAMPFGFDRRNITMYELAEAEKRIMARNSNNACTVLSVSHLGHMTEEEFKN